MNYNLPMFEIIKSDAFEGWLLGLRDRMARLRIQVRIDRMRDGNMGDVKPARDGVLELRIDHGPGYRVYFIKTGSVVLVLLGGGDKRTQDADIARAVALAKHWKE